jgi:pimeloyl-ACP methyl ester carboxylesterase
VLALAERGQGPAVLLLHGQPGSAEEFDPVLAELGDDLRSLVPDRRGYGATAGSAAGIAEQAAELAELLVSMEASPAVVVGHSFGGGVALQLALDHPDVVRGLVLAASVGGAGSVTAGDAVLAAPLVGAAASALGLLGYGQLLPRLPRRWARPGLLANVPRQPSWLRRSELRAFIDEQRHLVREEPLLEARLGELRCPAVVLQGSLDLIVAPAAGRDLAWRLEAELVELDGVGHLLPRDAPAAIADAVRRLAGVDGAIG